MLHRLALRVLPTLTLAVTEPQVRRRKRWVMMVPGLVAFAIYRLAKHLLPLSEPLVLLALSGCVAMVTAIGAYRIGRDCSLFRIWQEDGAARLMWMIGWIGFAYGVQLSLLVLALLRVVVHYDFMQHPDGPAMMAIIIACTSVARDAFEIGYVRRMQRDGTPILTFPDGAAFHRYVREQPRSAFQWTAGAAVTGVLIAVIWSWLPMSGNEIGQLLVVTLVAGTFSLSAYLAGERRLAGWRVYLSTAATSELFRFWWWPGLAFAATYYLVLSGLAAFIFKWEPGHAGWNAIIAGAVSGVMALYSYYLGTRRREEDRIRQVVPSALLRCPFVMGILSKQSSASPPTKVGPLAGSFISHSGQ